MQTSLKFAIITPTILRPSLAQTCASVDSQSYPNWQHLVIVDNPEGQIPESLNTPGRQWFKCDRPHHNCGNTCRRSLYDKLPPDTDYILYMDDDNIYLPNALQTLADELIKQGEPSWGIFPMNFLGKHFCDPRPRLNYTDANQVYHKPSINGVEIKWPETNEYAADGRLVNWLTVLTPPTVLSTLPELTQLSKHSWGAPSSDEHGPYTVIIPNKYPDVIDPLIRSLKKFEHDPNILVVADNHSNSYGFNSITVNGKFIFSKSANAGILRSAPSDVILINDDVRLIQPNTFDRLFRLAYSDPTIGILSPLVDGGVGNVYMSPHSVTDLWKNNKHSIMYRKGTANDFISFACVYLKRWMLDEVGTFDEGFIGYGREDTDLCIRAVQHGWKIAITRDIVVQHGDGGAEFVRGSNWNTSFKRVPWSSKPSTEYFHQKYPKETRLFAWPIPYTKQPKIV